MGTLDVRDRPAGTFTRALLRDLSALERMLEEGLIESGARRIGVEQELILVDRDRRPAPVALEVLDAVDAPPFTTELARFNIEINVPPVPVAPGVLSTLELQLAELIGRVEHAAAAHGADVVLTGILPCLRHSDLGIENMTPRERYRRLNEATMALTDGRVLLQILGTDELRVEHDSVMLEACNTSFQVHVQVDAAGFARVYNAAQAMIAPVLAAAVNSPYLFRKRLWAETRIAVFHQSLDTRASSPAMREVIPRVRFGERWVESSAAQLFEEDIARFRPLLTREPEEDPLAVLDEGGVPRLDCLQLHNGTIYRWNRPCYGITDGRPHLRIECRALPSGPTVVDEVANLAFWLGLLAEAPERYGDIGEMMAFDDAKSNFLSAARSGLSTSFTWLDGEPVPAPELIREQLLPLAGAGLRRVGVDGSDADRFLGVIDERVARNRTGTRWLERSAIELKEHGTTAAERCAVLTGAMIDRRRSGRPVHEWEIATAEDLDGAAGPTVDEYMTTTLLTVNEDELIDLAAFIMDREQIRQILVEDADFQLVGLVSYRSLLRLLAKGRLEAFEGSVPVKEIMVRDPVTVPPATSALEAIRIMREEGISCLPVVQDGKLVGVLSERDFMPVAAELLHQRLAGERAARSRGGNQG